MAKPLPTPVTWDEGFWASAREGILSLQRCRSCGRLQFYPRPVCVECFGRDLRWERVSGRGTIHSFTFVRVPVHPEFRSETPIVLAEIDLQEGVRMLSRIVGAELDQVQLGAAVTCIFVETASDAIRLPHFQLVR